MFNILFLILVFGASMRITRLINEDSIVEPLRKRLPSSVRHFTDCPWCVGFWVALGFVAADWYWHDSQLFHAATLVLTISWVTGIAAQWLDSPPPPRVVHLAHSGEINQVSIGLPPAPPLPLDKN